jgi:3-hydroxyisobutyrate dehydrogenase-like beta-hydroxyacid dehydrogenase
VFGRPQAAEAAKLLVVAAGPGGAVERCRPLFEAIGDRLFVLGSEAVAANALKLAGNLLIASKLEALGEAFALMRKSGVDPAQFLQIVNGALFKSPVYENYGKIVLEEKFQPPGFKMGLGLKDVRLDT